jgi:aminoglycoside phosphotransferase family enzyme/predicted kinase
MRTGLGINGVVQSERPFAAVHETHIGVVFLVGDRAYKIKKPVRNGFLDFSTPELRLAACRREIELNRRLAADVYLGLSEVTDPAGGPAEPAVVMRRMPPSTRLSTLVSQGDEVSAQLRALARLLAAFHSHAGRGPHIDAEGSRDALLARWTDSFAQVQRFRAGVLGDAVQSDIERLTHRFLAGRTALFDDRVAEGRILDGHGDLIADDVFCLPDGPRALDCLEFDDRLRYVDGLDDAAFLAMDLDRLGSPDLAELFLDDYAEFAGDPAPAALRHHYIAYRAFVRTKVACLRYEQGDRAAGDDVKRDADLTLRHLELGAVRMALVGGLPGAGKTTVAGALADGAGAVLLSSDRLRKELAGLDPLTPAPAGYREQLYAPAATDRVYTEMRRRAALLMARGESVVLDASWTSAEQRRAAVEVARASSAELVELRCVVAPAIAAARVRDRAPGPSDASAPIAAAMATDADPWPSSTDIPTITTLAESSTVASSAWRSAPHRTKP